MSTWASGYYTNQGLAQLATLTQGTKLNISRITIGTGMVSETQLPDLTEVVGERFELKQGTVTYPTAGHCIIPVVLTNDNVTKLETFHQIGVYAITNTGDEILYMILQDDNGTEVLPYNSLPGYSSTWNIHLNYGQADSVEVTVEPSYQVTPIMLEEVKTIAESGVSEAQTGTMPSLENTANLPFSTLSIYGKSEQNGVPTATAPVKIVSVGEDGNVTIEVYGNNLANLPDKVFVNTGLTWDCKNGAIKVTGTTTEEIAAGSGINYYLTGQKGTFTVSGSTSKVAVYAAVTKNGVTNWYENQSFTLDGTETFAQLYCQINGLNVSVDETVYPMLNIGNTALPWEPCKHQTVTVATPNGLHGVPVETGGNFIDSNGQRWICDELDLVKGTFIQRTKKLVFDGTENWAIVDGTYPIASVTDQEIPLNSSTGCFSHGEYRYISTEMVGNAAVVTQDGIVNIRLGYEDSVDAFKSFLATQFSVDTPVSIVYPLAEIVETPLSAAEIEACKALCSNNPQTIVMNDSNAEMGVDCIKAQHEPAFGMVNLGIKAVSGQRTARFTVGTVTNGWTSADCDYLCDGTADDVEINAAIQALPESGGEIVILDGTYTFNNSVIINKDHVIISGNGSATELVRGWKCASSNSANGGALICISANHVTVTALKIDDRYDVEAVGSQSSHGIYMMGVYNDITVTRVEFINAYHPIKLSGVSVDEKASYVRFENNKIDQSGYRYLYGYGLEVSCVENLIIKGNLWTTTVFAPQVSLSSNIVYSDNVIENAFEYGADFSRCKNLKIIGNLIVANTTQTYGFRGIVAGGTENCGIEDNIIIGYDSANVYGVVFEPYIFGEILLVCKDVRISGNVIQNTRTAITVTGGPVFEDDSPIIISGNICENASDTAIHCSANTDSEYDGTSDISFTVIISDNICINADVSGISCSFGTNCIISGNTCIGSEYGIEARGLRYSNIIGNVCRDNTRYSIYIGNNSGVTRHTSKNNLIAANQLFGKNYTNSGSTGDTFVDNKYN